MKSNSFLYCFFILLLVASNIKSQSPFNNIYDFGAYQSNGHQIFEYEKRYYVTGKILEKGDTLFENNIFTGIVDQDGKVIHHSIWDNPLEERLQSNGYHFLNEEILINNKAYFTPSSVSFIDNNKAENCILVMDLETENSTIEQANCYNDSLEQQTPISSIEFPIKSITSANANIDRTVNLTSYNLTNNSYRFYDLSPDPRYAWNSIELLTNEDKDELLIIGLFDDYEYTFDVNESKFGLFILRVDDNFNIISEHKYGTHLIGSLSNMASIRDSEGNIVITTHEIDTTIVTSNTSLSEVMRRPIIMKFDKDLNLLWFKPFHEDAAYTYSYPHYYESIVQAHNSNDYILVGNNNDNPFNANESYGVIGRITQDGDQVWYYRVGSLFGERGHQLFDVAATSDGHYIASGTRNGILYEEDGTTIQSVLQTWLIKFDNDGQIMDVLSNTDDIDSDLAMVKIFPNPVGGNIFIQQNTTEKLSYHLIDTNGVIINSKLHGSEHQLLYFDTSTLSPGIYHIIVRDTDDQVVTRENIAIVR